MAVHLIVTGANELFTLSSPESRGTSTWIKLGPWWMGWAAGWYGWLWEDGVDGGARAHIFVAEMK